MNKAKIDQFMKEVDLFSSSCLIQQKQVCFCRIYAKIHYLLKLFFDFFAGIWRVMLQFLSLRRLVLSSRNIHILGTYLRSPVIKTSFSGNIYSLAEYCEDHGQPHHSPTPTYQLPHRSES